MKNLGAKTKTIPTISLQVRRKTHKPASRQNILRRISWRDYLFIGSVVGAIALYNTTPNTPSTKKCDLENTDNETLLYSAEDTFPWSRR